MSTYEVHVPCGKHVTIICKEEDEEMKIVKNGTTLFSEGSAQAAVPIIKADSMNKIFLMINSPL